MTLNNMRHAQQKKNEAKIKIYISQSNNTKYILQFNCEVMQNKRKKNGKK